MALAALSACTVGAALVALLVVDARSHAGLVAAWGAQVAVASALIAVRQWRFAPRRRAVEATVLVIGSVVAVVTVVGFVVVPVALWIALRAPTVDAPRPAREGRHSRVRE
jgi:hypothetical protein